MPACTGECCARFPAPAYDRLVADPERFEDGPFILAMLEPDGEMFTCRHFDPVARRCTVYEQRPRMCSEYPYANACEHCGGELAPEDLRARLERLKA